MIRVASARAASRALGSAPNAERNDNQGCDNETHPEMERIGKEMADTGFQTVSGMRGC